MPKNVMCKNCNNYRCDWCEKVIDSPDPNMPRTCQYFWVRTNADRIRAMSDEELRDFLQSRLWICETHKLCVECPMYSEEVGCISVLEWLKQPAEVDDGRNEV